MLEAFATQLEDLLDRVGGLRETVAAHYAKPNPNPNPNLSRTLTLNLTLTLTLTLALALTLSPTLTLTLILARSRRTAPSRASSCRTSAIGSCASSCCSRWARPR